ncbi:MAG: 3-hydroxyacyl-CoA dehydrogenase NAD-binding domain-containing protein, partial [Pararhizobium sp.]
RLPRLVGVAETIRLATSGRRVRADEALQLGMVDVVADGDPVESAIMHLGKLSGQKRVLRDLAAIASSPAEIEAAEKAARRKAAGSDAVDAAIASIHAGAILPAEEALAAERATSLQLRRGEQSKALRHLFFAERAALKLPAAAEPRPVSTVGVVGTGQMGRGIALAFAERGYAIRLAEANEAGLAAGVEALVKSAEQLSAKARIPSAETLMARISGGPLEAMADCDLVIEAIVEDMAAKAALLADLDRLCRVDAILASNTSYLDINALAAATRRPAQVAGLHFFNPANVMRLVEVVHTDTIAPETEATLLAVAKKLGKIPVVASVSEGFIGNRIFSAYRRQAEFLVEEGAFPEDVDRAMRAFGMAMGPFAVFDLAGLDIAWTTRKRLAPTRDPRERYVAIADRLCEAGRFGRKAGRGWYDYSSSAAGEPDPAVRRLIEQASADAAVRRRRIDDAEIEARLLAAIINEAALVLADGVARRPSDIDLVFVHGYGFPAVKGGPLHWASRQSRKAVHESVRIMADASGVGVQPAENLDETLDAATAA